MQGGLHVAACIKRDLASTTRKAYRYRDLGSAAYISRGHALLQAGPIKLTGAIGWLGWAFIHIAFLTGVRNRFSTVGTWITSIARGDRGDRTFILGSSGHPHEPYTWGAVHQRGAVSALPDRSRHGDVGQRNGPPE
jgi:NADH dehydrogenase